MIITTRKHSEKSVVVISTIFTILERGSSSRTFVQFARGILQQQSIKFFVWWTN
uniref:Uncharacterized protein n=1 Tax=Solanum lycopersicum TaxID=4081 RepID=A0A3Q7GI31_SOLLC